MRVGLLVYGDMDTVSGGYLYNRQLMSYLQSQGEQVTIISLPLRDYLRHVGDNFGERCMQRIAAADIDILIQDAMVHPSVFLLNRRLAGRLGIPVVTLVHLLTSFDHHARYSVWLYRAIERRFLASVSGIIANSQTTLVQARDLLRGNLPPHCTALPAGDHFPEVGIDHETIRQRALAPGPLKILVVGNVIRRKGLHVLIQALHLLSADEFQVTVVGRLDMEPRYVDQILKLIRCSRLQERITLMGPVQSAPLADLYRQHHLMALPSAYESYGIVYVEAQQFGLPVIGTTAGAAREIIRHGDNGYLIAPEDHHALAKMLQSLNRDRRRLQFISLKALAAYSLHPKWAQSCEVIRQYLYARLDENGRPATH